MGFKIIKYIDIDYFDKTLFIYYFNHFFPMFTITNIVYKHIFEVIWAMRYFY